MKPRWSKRFGSFGSWASLHSTLAKPRASYEDERAGKGQNRVRRSLLSLRARWAAFCGCHSKESTYDLDSFLDEEADCCEDVQVAENEEDPVLEESAGSFKSEELAEFKEGLPQKLCDDSRHSLMSTRSRWLAYSGPRDSEGFPVNVKDDQPRSPCENEQPQEVKQEAVGQANHSSQSMCAVPEAPPHTRCNRFSTRDIWICRVIRHSILGQRPSWRMNFPSKEMVEQSRFTLQVAGDQPRNPSKSDQQEEVKHEASEQLHDRVQRFINAPSCPPRKKNKRGKTRDRGMRRTLESTRPGWSMHVRPKDTLEQLRHTSTVRRKSFADRTRSYTPRAREEKAEMLESRSAIDLQSVAQPRPDLQRSKSVPVLGNSKQAPASPARRIRAITTIKIPWSNKQRPITLADWTLTAKQEFQSLRRNIEMRFPTLEELDQHIVQQSEYQDAVKNVIDLMVENKLTLNHVNQARILDNFKENNGHLAPAFDFMLGHNVGKLDKDDICKGLGYYDFGRISTGAMNNGPNFNLSDESQVMFFIDPQVLSTRHFIACRGNAARLSAEKCPGKLHSWMTKEDALQEALRAVKKLEDMIQNDAATVPLNNEIAVFRGFELSFVYPHFAVLEGSPLLLKSSHFHTRAFKVTPTTGRYEAGKQAIKKANKVRNNPIVLEKHSKLW